MSENDVTPVKSRKSRVKVLFAAVAVLLLLLAYGAGIIALPFSVLLSFQNRNCDAALTLHRLYAGLYPKFLEDKSLSSPVRECEAYALAVRNEENELWRDAYDAYQVYLTTYSSGLYVPEAQEHSGIALMNIVKDQVEQKQYEEAVANLNLIISGYPDTSMSEEAWTRLPVVYISWGTDLRESGDLEGSEQVLNDFKSWSLTYQRNEAVIEAQRELAQTYLDWGLELQSQKKFEDALAKFDLGAAADPQSQFDSAAQVKSGQSKVYVEWGNELLEQDQFPAAIEKFQLAVAKSEGTDDDSAGDAFANGLMRWADKLRADEDFVAALEHLGSAQEAAASDTMQQTVATALQDTYLAFSRSSGPQARRAMKEALQAVCKEREAPDLPIFGLNKDTIRFGIHGIEDPLPENLAARTPGEMHYVACITADNRTIQSREQKVIVLKVARGYFYRVVEQFRVQVVWNVRLLKVDTIENAAEQTFTGAPPPPFSDSGGNYFFGPTPMEEFTSWLESVIP